MRISNLFRSSDSIVGLNRRNRLFVERLNPRNLYPLVDDKLLTKQRLAEFGLPCPLTLHVFETLYDTRFLDQALAGKDSFVVKPARGRRGQGILLLTRANGRLFDPDHREMPIPRIQKHVRLILCGEYSFANREDRAFAEEMLRPPPDLVEISGGGVADVRVIVHQGSPIMAMLRLPTRKSRGRANLHAGGVGAGITLDTGLTCHAVSGGRRIERHPDTGRPLTGWTVPRWTDVLAISRDCYRAIPLGYLGVDVIIDRERGPVVVELNARPGLNIQLANNRGLWTAIQAAAAQTYAKRVEP